MTKEKECKHGNKYNNCGNCELEEKENWEKDFESLWEVSTDNNGGKEPFEFERLKKFVYQLLQEEREKTRKEFAESLTEKLEELRPLKPYPNANNGYNDELDQDEIIFDSAIVKSIEIIKSLT